MHKAELNRLKTWFSEYCRSFHSTNPAEQKNFSVKEDHTYHVCNNMLEISADLGLDAGRAALAESIALFHDVGRFPQYQKYGTFRDDLSTNHAALGAKVLIEKNVLREIAEPERMIILRAVTLHNIFIIPESVDEDTLLFLRMIRDADKLDIWRVFIDYYARPDQDRASAVGLGLPDNAEYSPEVLASVNKKEMVQLKLLRTLNDFKLLQLAWIFDLNFTRSLQLVLERSYIDAIAATLPRTCEISAAIDSIREYVDAKSCVR